MSAVSQKVADMTTLPAPLQATDLIYVVRQSTSPYNFKATPAGELFAVITGTRAEILALKNGADLIPSMNYYISDRDILITAATIDTFLNEGTWYRDTNLKSFGSIIYSGSAGATGVVSVNGVAISTSVAFTVDLPTTMTALAANINAFQSNYVAYDVGQSIIIEAATAGTSANGRTITTTASGGLTTSITNMANGVAVTTQQLSVVYDIVTNEIYKAYDAYDDIVYTTSSDGIAIAAALGLQNPIETFRWGDKSYLDTITGNYISAFSGCKIDALIQNTFCINTTFAGSYFDISRLQQSLFIDSSFIGCEIGYGTTFVTSVYKSVVADGLIAIGSKFSTYSYFNSCSFAYSNISDCDLLTCTLTNFTADDCIIKGFDTFSNQTLTRINCSGTRILKGNFDLCLTSPTMTGASTLGLSGSAIPLFVVPQNFSGFGFTMVWGTSLSTTSSPELIIGLATDGTDCFLSATTTTALNSGQQNGVAVVASTGTRQIIATPSVANITSGTFRIRITGMLKS